MNNWLGWLVAQWHDMLTMIMVVAVVLNIYAFIRQQRTLVELRRLLLRVREGAIERRPMVLNGAGGHRAQWARCLRSDPDVAPHIVGGEPNDK